MLPRKPISIVRGGGYHTVRLRVMNRTPAAERRSKGQEPDEVRLDVYLVSALHRNRDEKRSQPMVNIYLQIRCSRGTRRVGMQTACSGLDAIAYARIDV